MWVTESWDVGGGGRHLLSSGTNAINVAFPRKETAQKGLLDQSLASVHRIVHPQFYPRCEAPTNYDGSNYC